MEAHKYISQHTKLVSFMLANNETGRLLKEKEYKHVIESKRNALFHMDAVQALGKVEIDVEQLGCDMMSLSAHKVYGPKGTGCLWVRDGVELDLPHLGTPNVPGIAGFGEALNILNEQDKLNELGWKKEEVLLLELYKTKIDFIEHVPRYDRVPGIISVAFPGISNVELVLSLSDKGVLVSTGSACSGGVPKSRVLEEEGIDQALLGSTIRISLGRHNDSKDLKKAAQLIAETVQELKDGS